jgi:hypothetical protein
MRDEGEEIRGKLPQTFEQVYAVCMKGTLCRLPLNV